MERFDFSTLYTKIPHDKLTTVLCKLVVFCFKGGAHQYLSVNEWGAKWVVDPDSFSVVYDKTKIKLAIRYLMSNCHFVFGNRIFKQHINIPTGSHPAPFFANLFLLYFENKWVRNVQRSEFSRACKFATIFQFIDDLLTMNDDGEFARSLEEIYPPELELKKENEGTSNVTFLDLNMETDGVKFATSLYDKRNAFLFSIVRMSFLCSNIPSRMFYFLFGAEILRTARVSTTCESFLSVAEALVRRLLRPGGKYLPLKKVLGKIYARHPESFSHLFSDASQLFHISGSSC